MQRTSSLAPLALLAVLGCANRIGPPTAKAAPVAEHRPSSPVPSARAEIPVTPELVSSSHSSSEAMQPSPPAEPVPREAVIALDVPDFLPSVLRFPDRAGPAPVLVVAHGAGGTPEAHCQLWARISQEQAILLCLRGRARGPLAEDGDYYPDHPTLERETFAALAALRARFPERVAAGAVFYAGFSQGATMGSLMLVEHAREVTRLALVEGGFSDWNVARARAFHDNGGERVLFVCGRKECAGPARNAAHWFSEAGVAAQVEYVQGAGHTHDARVEARITALYPWFVAGDARWANDDANATQRAYTQTTGTPSNVPSSAGASVP